MYLSIFSGRDDTCISAFSVVEMTPVSKYFQLPRLHLYLSIFSGRDDTCISVFSVVEMTRVSQYFQWSR